MFYFNSILAIHIYILKDLLYYLGKLTSIKDNIMICLNKSNNYALFLGSVVYIYKTTSTYKFLAKGTLFEVSKDELKVLLIEGNYWDIKVDYNVYSNGSVIYIPVGYNILGNIIDPLGNLLLKRDWWALRNNIDGDKLFIFMFFLLSYFKLLNFKIKVNVFMSKVVSLWYNVEYRYKILGLIGRFLIYWFSRGSICLSVLPFENLSSGDKMVVKYVENRCIDESNVFLPTRSNEETLPGDFYEIRKNIIERGVEFKDLTEEKRVSNIDNVNHILDKNIQYSHLDELVYGYSDKPSRFTIDKNIEQFNLISDKRKYILDQLEKESVNSSGYYKNQLINHFKKKGIYDDKTFNKLFNNNLNELRKMYDQNNKFEFDNKLSNYLYGRNMKWTVDLDKTFKVNSLDVSKTKMNGLKDYTQFKNKFYYSKDRTKHFLTYANKFLKK